LFCLSTAVVALAGPGDAKKGAQTQPMPGGKASATIEGRSGSTLTGTAEFSMHSGQMMISVSIKGATPGEHGLHIHEKGDCSAPDATSAGGHFNPGGHQHGAPDAKEHHGGDLGNITVGADGSGTAMIHTSDLSFEGPSSVLGRSIVVHEKADDFVTQPTGNSGGRIGCGVIK